MTSTASSPLEPPTSQKTHSPTQLSELVQREITHVGSEPGPREADGQNICTGERIGSLGRRWSVWWPRRSGVNRPRCGCCSRPALSTPDREPNPLVAATRCQLRQPRLPLSPYPHAGPLVNEPSGHQHASEKNRFSGPPVRAHNRGRICRLHPKRSRNTLSQPHLAGPIRPVARACRPGGKVAGTIARMPSCASPFLEIDPTEWFCSNALCFAIPDHKPASRGHLLIITRRHVATWFDCTLPEQNDLMALVNQAKTLLDQQLVPQPDGYQVLFNSGTAAGQTVPHAHVHLIPRYADGTAGPCGSAKPEAPEQASPGGNLPQAVTVDSPVATNVSNQASDSSQATQPGSLPSFSLTVGHPAGPLWPSIANRIPGATEIELVASFAQPSGLDLIRKALFSAYEAGARIRLLVGDYLCITSPDALRTLSGWMAIAGHSRGLAGHFEAPALFTQKHGALRMRPVGSWSLVPVTCRVRL